MGEKRADHRAYRAYHRAYRAYQRRAYERCCNPYRDGHRAYRAYRAYQPRTLTEHTASIPRAYREHTASIPPASIPISRALTFRAAFAVACRANHSSARRRYGYTRTYTRGPVRENSRPLPPPPPLRRVRASPWPLPALRCVQRIPLPAAAPTPPHPTLTPPWHIWLMFFRIGLCGQPGSGPTALARARHGMARRLVLAVARQRRKTYMDDHIYGMLLHMYACTHTPMCTHVNTYPSKHMYTHMQYVGLARWICMYTHVYLHVYTHVCIWL